MNKIIAFSLFIVLLAGGASYAADIEDAIDARQALMRVYAFNVGIVAEMAKGETEYDAELATTAAQNLALLSQTKNSGMWPQGSSNADEGMADKTDALPEAWTTYPEVLNKQEEAAKAMQAFVDMAGKDLDSLRAGLKDVGAGCKGCHKKFRADDD